MCSMEPVNLLESLQKCGDDILPFRKLINIASSYNYTSDSEHAKQWQDVLIYILELVVNTEINLEKRLLAAHAFFALLSATSTDRNVISTLKQFFELNSQSVCFCRRTIAVTESEFFKLICIYGYLQVNQKEIFSEDIYLLMFVAIYENCIKYTKHSYFSYRILHIWLDKTIRSSFWDTCNPIVERKLEALIFSNWCNAISEISRQNSSSIFNMYLEIMSIKYDGFLKFIFDKCVNGISWQNDTKYNILSGILAAEINLMNLISYEFLLSLCTTLTKHNLRCAGAKVYTVLMKKLSEDEWKKSFDPIMKHMFRHWQGPETTNEDAIQALCKYWLGPAIRKHRNLLPYLWGIAVDLDGDLVKSHLQRFAAEMRMTLPREVNVQYFLIHKNEVIRLNGFSICCNRINNADTTDQYIFLIKEFLYHNVNTTILHLREGIIKNIKILYTTFLRMCEVSSETVKIMHSFTQWLHEFLLDALEVGSCYQRKIVGLNLYKLILSFTEASTMGKANSRENVRYAMLFKKHMVESDNWTFTDKKSLFLLLRTVLDSSCDAKELAVLIIYNYFNKNMLSHDEKQILYVTALRYSNSFKFYDIESGAALFKLLATWLPLHELHNSHKNTASSAMNYSDFLFNEAASQLSQIKRDILKAVVQEKPFYGVLMALQKVVLGDGPEKPYLIPEFVEKILCLLKDATNFLLATLCSKSKNKEYSSSFAEMGLAINEAIKISEIGDLNDDELNLTPAHQVLVSFIWTSLKVICEMACEIGVMTYSTKTVECSINIIVTILFRCRHKGVVESAGVAIGNLTRALCNDAQYSYLPKSQIEYILTNEPEETLDITRRGAGLSIMFHRIIVGDSRRNRPLLHLAVELLLRFLSNPPKIAIEAADMQKNDSPIARRLHFLRTLVADKEIHSQLMPYMEEICLTAFKYLESQIWTIRNASLQLFGAVVPRLVGQTSGDALDYGTGYSINHLITHYPALSEYILKQLELFASEFRYYSGELYRHSAIVPILILLSKSSYSGSELVDHNAQPYVESAKLFLSNVFDNPVWYVRSLAAKAFAALTSFRDIQGELQKLNAHVSLNCSCNRKHGNLLAIKYLREKLVVEVENANSAANTQHSIDHLIFESPKISQCAMTNLSNSINQRFDMKQSCYILETISLELACYNINILISTFPFEQIQPKLNYPQSIQPGFPMFMESVVKLYAEYVKRSDHVNVENIRKILDSSTTNLCVVFLDHLSCYTPLLLLTIEYALFTEGNCSDSRYNALINFSMKTLRKSLNADMNELALKRISTNMQFVIDDNISHFHIRRLKFALMLLFSEDQAMINNLLVYIVKMCFHDEEFVRRTSVELLHFALYRFAKFTNMNQLTIIHACLISLKDEVSEIGWAIAKSLRTLVLCEFDFEFGNVLSEEIIYNKLLSIMIWGNIANKNNNLNFIKLWSPNITSIESNTTIKNPFFHDDNAWYREESKFLNACFFYIKDGHQRHLSHSISDTASLMIAAKYELQKKINFSCIDLPAVLNTKYTNYLLRKLGMVINTYIHNM